MSRCTILTIIAPSRTRWIFGRTTHFPSKSCLWLTWRPTAHDSTRWMCSRIYPTPTCARSVEVPTDLFVCATATGPFALGYAAPPPRAVAKPAFTETLPFRPPLLQVGYTHDGMGRGFACKAGIICLECYSTVWQSKKPVNLYPDFTVRSVTPSLQPSPPPVLTNVSRKPPLSSCRTNASAREKTPYGPWSCSGLTTTILVIFAAGA